MRLTRYVLERSKRIEIVLEVLKREGRIHRGISDGIGVTGKYN